MQKIIEEIREYVHSQWMLGELHGIRHWDRVYENGRRLFTPGVNPLVVGLFAYLHDSCRMDDLEDIDACFDSVRLDLWRVGIVPDPDRLATEKGKEIARNSDYKALVL